MPRAPASLAQATAILPISFGLKVLPWARAWGKMVVPFIRMPWMPSAQVMTGIPRRVLSRTYLRMESMKARHWPASVIRLNTAPQLFPSRASGRGSPGLTNRFWSCAHFSSRVISFRRFSTLLSISIEASFHPSPPPQAEKKAVITSSKARIFFIILRFS